MSNKNAKTEWGYHLIILALVAYDSFTLENPNSDLVVGNWAAVFIVIGLISTIASASIVGFKVARFTTTAVFSWFEQLRKGGDCEHEWVSGDNEHVTGASVCKKCKAFCATEQLRKGGES